ncbi:hypothetical protein [Sulfuriflexus sp.]|uniref:hypothetical protein n=1 Tax=Sulfuriflexus sp. TaxID=2015443 RepID=UPI0028CBE3D8|nr:hypothetical protein [Sulfuriflexus sp.]MDT8405134.1 hypothetical protein [Sulfuriflexus sp.]
MSLMQVHVNGQPQIDYDRNKPLTDKQQEYLDKMDAGMDAGISLGKEEIKEPDLLQRAKFVAGYLSQALFDENEQMIAASTSWLANRLPDLKQVKIIQEGEQISIDLVFDETRENQVKVDLQMPARGKPLH